MSEPSSFQSLSVDLWRSKRSTQAANSPRLRAENANVGTDTGLTLPEAAQRIGPASSFAAPRSPADKHLTTRRGDDDEAHEPPGELDKVIAAERQAIALRRKRIGERPKTPRKHEKSPEGAPWASTLERTSDAEKPASDFVGLALSGGGIRSAAFSLGVVQALAVENALLQVDYLSTVSGGGFTGAAVSSTMVASGGRFVFADAGRQTTHPEIADTAPVGHIRDYSNYLIPAGFKDLVSAITIVLRGLVANSIIVAPWILLFAAATIAMAPNVAALKRPYPFLASLFAPPVGAFGVSNIALFVLFLAYAAWALQRSFPSNNDRAEKKSWPVAPLFVALLLIFFGLQFVALNTFLGAGEGAHYKYAARIEALLAPLLAIVTLFKDKLVPFLERTKVASDWLQFSKATGAKLLIWAAALALPLLIWLLYITLCGWGIVGADDDPLTRWLARLVSWLRLPSDTLCSWGIVAADCEDRPHWLAVLASPLRRYPGYDVAVVYSVLAIIIYLISRCLRPNANSLHQLYRDRLGTAFLFGLVFQKDGSLAPASDPRAIGVTIQKDGSFLSDRNETVVGFIARPDGVVLPAGDRKVSSLDPTFAPYHLINCAVNLEGSSYLNKRGRNADFFLFSPLFVGSAATGYMPTLAYEQVCQTLDLASAVAISGAAVSSNMGAQSIRPLTPTLALLNVRLGYWIDNPLFLKTKPPLSENPSSVQECENTGPKPKIDTNYFFAEMFSRLTEEAAKIYLTDGGHIDNLGVYELLRRRCGLIIVVDAEADPMMTFGALISVQRFARIDLGIRINLPWPAIQKMSLQHTGANFGSANCEEGPHAALGTIDYGDASGLLLYIKSSLSGDENDYVLDYARRNASFPHETTGDQFFGEEQFEAYRALGFHIAQRLLAGDDPVSFGSTPTTEKLTTSNEPEIVALRHLLALPAPVASGP
jgi:Patatin-like phospholipase